VGFSFSLKFQALNDSLIDQVNFNSRYFQVFGIEFQNSGIKKNPACAGVGAAGSFLCTLFINFLGVGSAFQRMMHYVTILFKKQELFLIFYCL